MLIRVTGSLAKLGRYFVHITCISDHTYAIRMYAECMIKSEELIRKNIQDKLLTFVIDTITPMYPRCCYCQKLTDTTCQVD